MTHSCRRVCGLIIHAGSKARYNQALLDMWGSWASVSVDVISFADITQSRCYATGRVRPFTHILRTAATQACLTSCTCHSEAAVFSSARLTLVPIISMLLTKSLYRACTCACARRQLLRRCASLSCKTSVLNLIQFLQSLSHDHTVARHKPCNQHK